MVCLELFWTFFKIGLFSFGGGYGMISLMKEEVINHAWASEDLLYNFIAISESTPGPIAVNMATFIGSEQFGFLGSMCATIGVVLPAFIIMLVISTVFKNFKDNKYVNYVISGIKPVVIGLIISTGVILLLQNIIYNYGNLGTSWELNPLSIAITAFLAYMTYYYKKVLKVNVSPIALILIAAGLGIIAFY